MARPSGALRRLESRLPALQPVGQERGFRAHFQAVGERSRQRIHDDRRHYCARSSTQRRRSKKDGNQAIGRSCGGLTTKIHALVDALGNPANLMLTAGQIHDLACAQGLIENADPQALIADKAYDADSLIDSLAEREITPVIRPKFSRSGPTGLGYHPSQLRTGPSRGSSSGPGLRLR